MTRGTGNSARAKRPDTNGPATSVAPPDVPSDAIPGTPADAVVRLLDTPLVAVLDALPEAAFLYAPDGSIVRANRATRVLLGLDADLTFFTLPYPERLARLNPRDALGRPLARDDWHITRVLKGEAVTAEAPIEVRITTLDGREVMLSYTAVPVRDSTGEIVGALSLGRDITAQRRIEHEAAVRASQMMTAFESMTDGVVVMGIVDGQLRPLHMNAANHAMFGLESGRVGSAHIVLYDDNGRLLPEEEWPYQRILRGETLRGGNAIDMVIGEPVARRMQVSVSGAPIRDEHGQIVGCVAVHRDVTERRRLERRTQEALEALLTLAELVVSGDVASSQAADVAALGAPLVQAATRVLGCKRAALVAMRRPGEPMQPLAVVGLPPEQERLWKHGEPHGAFLRDGMPQWLRERLEGGEATILDYAAPPMSERPNPLGLRKVLFVALRVGQEVVGMLNADYGDEPHEYSADELRLAEAVAKLLGLVVERARLLRERAAAQGKALALEEINRRMDEFLGIASHELKTPVTVIKANLQMLTREGRASENRTPQARGSEAAPGTPGVRRSELETRMIARALDHVDRLTRLVDDMLDVSRVREGKLEFRLEAHDLASIVAESVEGQRQAHPQRQITFATKTAAPLVVVADADRIGQVVTNYLTNALKYSREGTTVEVTLRREGESAVLSVRDHGVGIPADELEHVWEPFRRAAGIDVQSGSGVGLGLGLYICRTIVERHGGQVHVTSAVGQGSTFSFTLPLAPSE